MRLLAAVLYPVLAFAAALASRPLDRRPGEKSIDWSSVPSSTYEILYDHETIVTVPEGPPKGVIIVLSSCDTQVSVWGFPSHQCKHCQGRPEEMLIVYHAMRRNYVIVVVGPLLSGGGNFCFERTWPPKGSRETAELRRTLALVLDEHSWWELPRYILGTSAGGAEAFILAARFPVQAVASMLMGVHLPEMLDEPHLQSRNPDAVENQNVTWAYPPVLLLKAAMDWDGFKNRIDDSMEFFKGQGVHAELIVMEPYPIRPHTFGRALRFIDSEQSLALFRDLRTAGLINAQGYGKLPPANGSDTWVAADVAVQRIMMSLSPGDSAQPQPVVERHSIAVHKILWAAQAVHETRGRETNKIIDFFERQAVPDKEQISDSSSELVQQWRSNADILATELGGLPGRHSPCARTSQALSARLEPSKI